MDETESLERSSERHRSIVCFRVAGAALALPAEAVEEVVVRSTVTPIPCAPAHVPGLIAVRGDAVPLFDVGIFFGLDGHTVVESDREPRVLLVRSSRYRVGIFCDAVMGIASVAESRIDEPRACRPASLRRHALGETYLHGAVIPLLDLEGLLEAGRAR